MNWQNAVSMRIFKNLAKRPIFLIFKNETRNTL